MKKKRILAEVSGKPVTLLWNQIPVPAKGKTTLQLMPNRLVEKTKWVVAERYSETILSEIDSVDILTHGNPLFLVFFIFIIPLILFFLFKRRFLVIRSRGNVHAVTVKGDLQDYYDFMEAVLAAAEKAKVPAPRPSYSPPSASSPDHEEEETVVAEHSIACASCGTEMEIPEKLLGKKVRCPSCKGVVQT